MSELTKQQLAVENSNSFPNNNTGFITPTLLRTFNGNIIDSLVDEVTYNADSASWTSDITALEQFSSSLVTNFVTSTQLSASSSTLQNNINTKLNTASFNAYTASQGPAATGSLLLTASAVNNVITFTKGDGSTFPVTVATGSAINTGSFVTTSSFNSYTASASTNTSASINAATSSLSSSISSSIGSLSASVAAINATQLSTASFNTYTASASTNVSGAINVATQSLSSSVAAINALQLTTASVAGDTITFTKGNGTTFPITVSVPTGSLPAGVVSSSAQIGGFGYATTSSVSQSVQSLNSATASYITSAQTASMTVLSASFAQTASFLLGTVASASYALLATSASVIYVQNTSANAPHKVTFVDASNTTGQLQVDNDLAYNPNTNLLTTTASFAITASHALNVTPTDVSMFLSQSTFNTYTASAASGVSASINSATSSLSQSLSSSIGALSASIAATDAGQLSTSSFNSFTASVITTGSSALTQNITGSLIISGATFNGKIEAPTLVLATTTLDTLFESTASTSASSVISQIDFTRIGAGATGDSTGVRLQTISGSDTSGDTLFSRVTTNINRHTTTAMTGSVVNTIVQSTWATGSGGTRVSYASTITANAQSASATITLAAGNAASNNAGGTASLQAGRVNIGATGATINITGSNPNILSGSLSGSLISNLGDIYTGSNNANFIITLGSASMATLLSGSTTNANTLYFVI